jgi:hypothetical protein
MKIVTRFSAPASRIIPPIEPSRSAANSPGPLWRSTSEPPYTGVSPLVRHASSTARIPLAQQRIAMP